MSTPGKGRSSSRLWDVENRQAEQSERLAPPDCRVPAPFGSRGAVHRAVALAAITRGTFGEVAIYYWNGTAYVDSGKRVNAGGFLLNTGQSILVNQAIFVIHLPDNTWEVLTGNCAVKDWE